MEESPKAPRLLDEFAARYPYPFDPFQTEAMEALEHGRSVLVAAPTGTGKTVIAEFGLFLARRAGLRAFYTTPIKALSNQKYRDFRAVYGDDVGLLTGDIVIQPEASVVVMTTEVLRNMLVQAGRALLDVGAIVFDEVHYMGDAERGTAWEEAILLAPRSIPLVCLSATVPNAAEIAAWLRAAHGDLACIFHDGRAVPLEHRYFLDGAAHLVVDGYGRRRKWFSGVGGELASRVRWGGFEHEPSGEREPHEEAEPWAVVRHLERRALTPAIYFLFSRRACEEAAASCLSLPPVEDADQLVREARARLADLPREDRELRQIGLLLRLLPRGVAVHHAGLLPLIKMLVEELFAAGRLRAVFATDTLAVGINMPAKTTVIGELSKWDGEQRRLLTPNEYRQMTGRAGRRGIDERGVSVILYSPWVSFERAMEIVQGQLLPLESAFAPDYSTALNLLRGPADRDRLAGLYARSLRRFQHDARLEALTVEVEQLDADFRARHRVQLRDSETWRLSRELSHARHELNQTQRDAALQARSTVDGLSEILHRFGYLLDNRPTPKAALLRSIFDTNALALAELIDGRVLLGLQPAALAEVVSWFTYDREVPIRGMPIPRPLQRLRQQVFDLQAEILSQERRVGLSISRPLNEHFQGIALAWAEERPLGEIAQRARMAEGDLVGIFQKTLDLLGQLRAAVDGLRRTEGTRDRRDRRGGEAELLLQQMLQADVLLRRGVVEASYRWAIAGPPPVTEEELGEDDLSWLVVPSIERPERWREQRPTQPPARAQRRREARRQEKGPAAESRAAPPKRGRTGGPPDGKSARQQQGPSRSQRSRPAGAPSKIRRPRPRRPR
ncbi:MAG: DEAD/DEAH box helicase [Chloroflexi bacterium]|nr:DEAD/DEAH box helicase [Chloroflexota bacterium]